MASRSYLIFSILLLVSGSEADVLKAVRSTFSSVLSDADNLINPSSPTPLATTTTPTTTNVPSTQLPGSGAISTTTTLPTQVPSGDATGTTVAVNPPMTSATPVVVTPIVVPTLAAVAIPPVVAVPPVVATPPPIVAMPPPAIPPVYAPPPPPGAGSEKTAVLSAITIVGQQVDTYNYTLGTQFTSALQNTFGPSCRSVVVTSWGTNQGRKLMASQIQVASIALFADGIAAAAGLATLQAADQSGALQKALQNQGMMIEDAVLNSASTVLPSNYQSPVVSLPSNSGIGTVGIILIAVASFLVFSTLVGCCCCQSLMDKLLCCCSAKDDNELPCMIKYGTQKDQAMPYFFNTDQQFTPTPGHTSKKSLTETPKRETEDQLMISNVMFSAESK